MAVILFKKMLRDIRTSLSAYILCILIVAIGLCGYSVLGLCYDNMVLSRDTFFRNTDYCDGFADTADTDLRAASRLEGRSFRCRRASRAECGIGRCGGRG